MACGYLMMLMVVIDGSSLIRQQVHISTFPSARTQPPCHETTNNNNMPLIELGFTHAYPLGFVQTTRIPELRPSCKSHLIWIDIQSDLLIEGPAMRIWKSTRAASPYCQSSKVLSERCLADRG